MRLQRLTITNFRCIRELDWVVGTPFACLIGPGDSGKSSVLDAIDYVLSPSWTLPVSDSDFYAGDLTKIIEIEAVVFPVPESLGHHDKFGMHLIGVGPDGEVHDEPEDADITALRVRLSITSSLEPEWRVVTERKPDGVRISASDRASLSMARLGNDTARHFIWNRGSALARLTESIAGATEAITVAQREARALIAREGVPTLADAIERAATAASQLGVGAAAKNLAPGLDPGSRAAIGLESEGRPLRTLGSGTQRLLALGLQKLASADGAILLIDELEQGLEPYRVRHLVRALRTMTTPVPGGPLGAGPQVIMTTHSPVALEELSAAEVHVVRNGLGRVTSQRATDAVQPLLRSSAEAVLSRRVLVCEGRTELGLSLGLEGFWATRNAGNPMAQTGTALADGGGNNQGAQRALDLARLGYNVAYFGDSDEEFTPPPSALTAAGVVVILWDDDACTEDRVFQDLPIEGVARVFDLVVDTLGPSELDSLRSRLPKGSSASDIPGLLDENLDQASLRDALAETADARGWFKQIERATGLGTLLADYLDEIATLDLAVTLRAVEAWVHADG